jgi:hypothetical protein
MFLRDDRTATTVGGRWFRGSNDDLALRKV